MTQAADARGPIPRAGEIPENRRFTMPVLTDDVQDAAEDILERHGGLPRQRRGVQSVARGHGAGAPGLPRGTTRARGGTVAALPRAFSNALRAARTGVPAADVTSFDRPAIREFQGGGANPFNWPKRALESVDDFFSTVAAEQTLYGAAFAQAKREGLSGDKFLSRVAQLKINPSNEILSEVESQRARLLFREQPGKIADAVLAAKRHLPALGYVAPFVRVPANIIRQGFEASPAGFAMPGARAGGRAGADALGRAAAGSLALAPLAYYAALGKITGDAPADPAKRAAFYESGKRS